VADGDGRQHLAADGHYLIGSKQLSLLGNVTGTWTVPGECVVVVVVTIGTCIDGSGVCLGGICISGMS